MRVDRVRFMSRYVQVKISLLHRYIFRYSKANSNKCMYLCPEFASILTQCIYDLMCEEMMYLSLLFPVRCDCTTVWA